MRWSSTPTGPARAIPVPVGGASSWSVGDSNGNCLGVRSRRPTISAVIEGLNGLKKACDVTVFTDSQYVKNGIESWIHNWKRRGWKTAAGKPVLNRDLWEALEAACAGHRIHWKWVKGHSGDPGNEEADRLANLGIPDPR
jgi:ribonuclease HI